MPCTHSGEAEIQLYSFLASGLVGVGGHLQASATLPMGNRLVIEELNKIYAYYQ
jgi:hypothetical protein